MNLLRFRYVQVLMSDIFVMWGLRGNRGLTHSRKNDDGAGL